MKDMKTNFKKTLANGLIGLGTMGVVGFSLFGLWYEPTISARLLLSNTSKK